MKYQVIYADPPWRFATYSKKGLGRSAEAHYDCMSLADIKSLPVLDYAAEDCALFLWVTDPLLPQALEVMRAWGFAYKTVAFTWAKQSKDGSKFPIGCGYWTRCLRGDARVFIMDPTTKRVELLRLDEVYARRERTMLIHTHLGWRLIHDAVKNSATVATEIKTPFATVACSVNHEWAVKLPKPHRVDWLPWHEIIDLKKRKTRDGVNLCFSTASMESSTPLPAYAGFDLTEDLAWLVGLFAAEGNYGRISRNGNHTNQVRFTLHSDEMHFVERIKAIVASLKIPGDRFKGDVRAYNHLVKRSNAVVIYFSSYRIRQFLEGFIGGIGAKGKRLNLDRLWQTTASFRRSLVRGILDGDGTKLKANYAGYEGFQNLRLANSGLIDDVRQVLTSIGVPTRLKKPYESTSPAGTITTLHGLYFSSPRCKNVELDGVEIVPAEIEAVMDVDSIDTYDLSVSDHVFVVEGLISHNSNPEMCLLGTRGKPLRLARNVRQLVLSPRREHSRKPDIVRHEIMRLCAGPYLELFSREDAPGWSTAMSNQAGLLNNGHVETRRMPSTLKEAADVGDAA